MEIICPDKKPEKRLNEVLKQLRENLDFNISFEEVNIMMDLDSNTLCITPIKDES